MEDTNTPMSNEQSIIINMADGRSVVSHHVLDGNVWMNQSKLTELFASSVPNISTHISNLLKEGELEDDSVITDYLTTATDGKQFNVIFYELNAFAKAVTEKKRGGK